MEKKTHLKLLKKKKKLQWYTHLILWRISNRIYMLASRYVTSSSESIIEWNVHQCLAQPKESQLIRFYNLLPVSDYIFVSMVECNWASQWQQIAQTTKLLLARWSHQTRADISRLRVQQDNVATVSMPFPGSLSCVNPVAVLSPWWLFSSHDEKICNLSQCKRFHGKYYQNHHTLHSNI